MARLLVVEDDADVRGTLTAALTFDGHDVISASNGLEAQQAVDNLEYDVVVTDLIMADMDGIQLVRQVRSRTPRTAIIAIAGGGRGNTQEYLKLARLIGAAATLEKPFELSAFRTTLASVLEKH